MKEYTTQEAAKILGITFQGVHQRIKRGQLIALKKGRDFFITEADLKKSKVKPVGRPPKKLLDK
jgi:excisionase family DNA binding protein